MSKTLEPYRYSWPSTDLRDDQRWVNDPTGATRSRTLPESREELAKDSRWPAFFPSQICIVTVSDGIDTAVEKVVGPSIVNRFPYIAALSFCIEEISARHHVRNRFLELIERGSSVAIQFFPPGDALDRVMHEILNGGEDQTYSRLERIGLQTRPGVTTLAPVFKDAYLVYEGKLAPADVDTAGGKILSSPYRDVGSHRLCFVEIEAIQLDEAIAVGKRQIHWTSLPTWQAADNDRGFVRPSHTESQKQEYIKGYTPRYKFPAPNTVAFVADEYADGMAIKRLCREPIEALAQLTNDQARWPCFFPSSLGMITAWADDGTPAFLPCGSTAVVSRHPMVIAPCISYSRINERYAPRASLDIIRSAGAFGCGVPYLDDRIVNAVTYGGNVSIDNDRAKLENAGLTYRRGELAPILDALPIFFECKVIGEEKLGTHVMFFGEVKRIVLREDISPLNPINWFPWAEVVDAQ